MQKSSKTPKSFIKNPVNDSKGCGGVMRAAPLGLHGNADYEDIKQLDMCGAELSAITHGHSLGYMPSALLTHILNRIVYPTNNKTELKDIISEARDTVQALFKTDSHIDELTAIINKAVVFSENDSDDSENIKQIGEGWVAEETLAIAIYCSLRYQNNFSNGIIAAVNHSGDSDSTGAVTGNILGALLGYENIEEKWTKRLELHDVISEIAEDLWRSSVMNQYGDCYDNNWTRKYSDMHWKNSRGTSYYDT